MGNQLSVLSGTVCDGIILTGLTMEHELILKNRLKTARAEQGISQGDRQSAILRQASLILLRNWPYSCVLH